MLYNFEYALAVNLESVTGPVEVGDFLFWLIIFFGLVFSKTRDRVKQDSLIAKGFIFKVSS